VTSEREKFEAWLEQMRAQVAELVAGAPTLADDQLERMRVLWTTQEPPAETGGSVKRSGCPGEPEHLGRVGEPRPASGGVHGDSHQGADDGALT
jgi:hypothetical protein